MNIANHRPVPRLRLLPVALVISALLTCGVAVAQGAPDERMRLVLDDTTIDVIGPVERDGALLTFRTLDGRLGSIQLRRVARVVSLASGRSAPPPAAAAPSRAVPTAPRPPLTSSSFSNDDLPGDAATATGGAISNTDLIDDDATPVVTRGSAWTNADLPPGAEPDDAETTDGADDVPPESVDRSALDATMARLGTTTRPGPPTAAVDEQPAVDPFAIEAELAALDEQIATAEREENTFYRLMVCVQNGISPRSPDCNPRLRPRPSGFPSQSERSLAAKLAEARERVESGTTEREALIERARAAGIALDLPDAP